jgi:hypothetical protein
MSSRRGSSFAPSRVWWNWANPRQFAESLAEAHVDDPDDPRGWLLDDATGWPIEHTRGVHDLDVLAALARQVGADTSGEDCTAFGRGRRARGIIAAIRRALGNEGPPEGK